jgi:hypothetical protein
MVFVLTQKRANALAGSEAHAARRTRKIGGHAVEGGTAAYPATGGKKPPVNRPLESF